MLGGEALISPKNPVEQGRIRRNTKFLLGATHSATGHRGFSYLKNRDIFNK
jgi:hypothetical protein